MTSDEINKTQKQQKRLNRVIVIALLLLVVVATGVYRKHSERHDESTPNTLQSSGASVFLSLPQPIAVISSVNSAKPTAAVTTPTISTQSATAINTSANPIVSPTVIAKGSRRSPVRQKIVAANPRPTPAPMPVLTRPTLTQKSAPPTRKAPTAPAPAVDNTCSDAGWYVQLGAFGRSSMATDLAKLLKSKGFSTCIGTLPQNHLYRVLVGPVPSRIAADTVTQRIANLTKHQGYPQYWSPVR
jgi:cell division septation protein DedD